MDDVDWKIIVCMPGSEWNHPMISLTTTLIVVLIVRRKTFAGALAQDNFSVDRLVVADIGQMASVISGIAEQMNLLPLNASIEAARTG